MVALTAQQLKAVSFVRSKQGKIGFLSTPLDIEDPFPVLPFSRIQLVVLTHFLGSLEQHKHSIYLQKRHALMSVTFEGWGSNFPLIISLPLLRHGSEIALPADMKNQLISSSKLSGLITPKKV